MARTIKIAALTGQSDFTKILLPSASTGKTAAVAQYIEEAPWCVKHRGPHGRTMFWEAARKGKLDVMEMLFDAGADIEAPGCYHRDTFVELTPLAIAEVHKRAKAVAFLRERGAKDHFVSSCYLGRSDLVANELARDARICDRVYKDCEDKARPLHYAIAGSEPGIFRNLLAHGADATNDGARLIRWAEWRDLYDVIEELLERGARPERGEEHAWLLDDKLRVLGKRYGLAMNVDARVGNFPMIVDASRGNHNDPDDPARLEQLLSSARM